MKRYAFLCGSAHEGFWQEKLNNLYNDLVSDSWSKKDIYIFPNGISEIMLEYALNNCVDNCIERENEKYILLYICTNVSVSDKDDCFVLGGEKIRKSVIEHYAFLLGNSFQVIFDRGNKEIKEEELGYVKC